jgi:hypothetical protein
MPRGVLACDLFGLVLVPPTLACDRPTERIEALGPTERIEALGTSSLKEPIRTRISLGSTSTPETLGPAPYSAACVQPETRPQKDRL